MNLTVEYHFAGPLSHKPMLRALEKAVDYSKTLDEVAAKALNLGLGVYKGGNHVAIHSTTHLGQLVEPRLAIITE